MGVDVVVGGAGDGEYAAVRRLFDTWERVFSRFRPESELNRVNANAASVAFVTPLFARVLRTALAAASATAGLVDSTLAVALEAAATIATSRFSTTIRVLSALQRPGAGVRSISRVGCSSDPPLYSST